MIPVTFQDCVQDCPQMTVVQAGRFVMGAEGGEPGRPEGPPHPVKVRKAFALGTYEVTQAQFEAFVKATGHEPRNGCETYPKGKLAFEAANWRDPGYGRKPRPNDPVVCVSWTDAVAYTGWLARKTGEPYRLPTEAEWEYAARAGSTTAFPWGDDPEQGCRYTNFYDASSGARFTWAASACDDGEPLVSEAGRYPANAFGLHDMIGNVWEWLADCYVYPYPATQVDERAIQPPEGQACEKRSVRGGSWATRPDRNRVTFRGRDPEDARYFMFGFRVARDLK